MMTNDLLTYSVGVFMGFFAIMNPISNTPIFLGLVEGRTEKEKKQIARKATFIALIIVVVFVVLGIYIFDVFGITIPAFKITGGILIFYVGFEMLMGSTPKAQSINQEGVSDGIAVSPLAIPLLAGPGTIVTAMDKVTNTDYLHMVIVIAIFTLMIVLTYIAFTLGDWIVDKVGKNIIEVIAKIMGLILAIIGTDMVITGIKVAFSIGAG